MRQLYYENKSDVFQLPCVQVICGSLQFIEYPPHKVHIYSVTQPFPWCNLLLNSLNVLFFSSSSDWAWAFSFLFWLSSFWLWHSTSTSTATRTGTLLLQSPGKVNSVLNVYLHFELIFTVTWKNLFISTCSLLKKETGSSSQLILRKKQSAQSCRAWKMPYSQNEHILKIPFTIPNTRNLRMIYTIQCR